MKRASKSAKPFITAVLSVNGNEGFAMIGDGWDIGPAAFEPVISDEVPGSEAWESAARQVSEQALRKRQARFPDRLIHRAWQTLVPAQPPFRLQRSEALPGAPARTDKGS